MKLKEIAENHGLTPEGVDYALTQYQIVICEITHGMLSKLSYDAKDIIRTAQERWCNTCDLKEQEPVGGWISVKDRLPEEHPSIFASLYGTEKWANGMWRNESDRVLVTIVFPDGTRTVDKGKLQDGTWKTGVSPVLPQEVTHWMPFPQAPKEEDT